MISVVIPAYNEEKTLHLCLDALCKQTIKEKYEVIVVDNNSTDKTESVIKRYLENYPVRYILEKQKGSGAARARGFDEAKGDIILTTDADTVVPEDWIERMRVPLQKPGVAAVTSPCTIDDPSPLKRKLFVFAELFALQGVRLLRGHYWMGGFSYGISKDLYQKAGKINKDLLMLDDVELSERVYKLGKIEYLFDLYVACSNRRYRDGLFKGLVSYIKPFFQMTYLGKNAYMRDYR